VPARQLGRLLGRCWTKLKQGAILIAETDNPLQSCQQNFPRQRLPVELLHYLFESQCFTVVDTVFSAPIGPEAVKIVRTGAGESFDLKQYRNYAVAGRR